MGRSRSIWLRLLAGVVLCSGCTGGADAPQDGAPDRPAASVKASDGQRVASSPEILVPDAGCRIDTADLRARFERSEFKAVEDSLQALHARVLGGECSDRWTARALGAFGKADPTLRPLLDAWVAADARSAWARAARGTHHLARAGAERGGASVGRTPRVQFAAMERALDAASEDLRAAIRFDPGLTSAHANLIDLARMSAGPLQERPILERGLRDAPHSYAIRQSLLIRLQPKWGGSLEAMERVLDDTRQYEDIDPELRSLRGYRLHAEADTLCIQKRHDEAIRLFDAALAQGDNSFVRMRRMDCLYEAERYDEAEAEARWLVSAASLEATAWRRIGQIERRRGNLELALAAFDQSLGHDDGDPNTLISRARTAWRLGQREAAYANLAQALQAAPSRSDVHTLYADLLARGKRGVEALRAAEAAVANNPSVASNWRLLADAQIRAKQDDAALVSIARGLELAPDSANLHYLQGWTLARRKKDHAAALPALRSATQLAPGRSTFWYELASVAWHARDCDVVTASRRFVELCDAGRCGKPNPKSVAWAKRRASDPAFARMCPREFAMANGSSG